MAQAGLRCQYALVWVIVPATIGMMVFGEMSGRVAAVAKQLVFNMMRHRLVMLIAGVAVRAIGPRGIVIDPFILPSAWPEGLAPADE